jgi:hypothetical protein
VINGNRPSQIGLLLDGSDINGANNNTPGSAVTKSGTSQFHGSIFELARNSAFDAKNFSDSAGAPIPPFRRNQSGVQVDGPVVRNKTFFLGIHENLRQRLGVTSRSVVPDANARLGIFPNGSRVPVDPSAPPYPALAPLPNERSFGDGAGEFVPAVSQATAEDFFTGRIDHRFSGKTLIFARFTADDATVAVPDAIRMVQAESRSRNRFLTVEFTRTATQRLLNTARFSFNRSSIESTNTYQRQAGIPVRACAGSAVRHSGQPARTPAARG